MGWMKGIPITAGLLAGNIFETNIGSMNDQTYSVAPDIHSNLLKYVQASGVRWHGVECKTEVLSIAQGNSELFAAFDVSMGQSSPYVKGQFRYIMEHSGNYYLRPVYRVWTDDTTYTDLVITSQATIEVNPNGNALSYYLFFAISEYQGETMVITGVSQTIPEPGSTLRFTCEAFSCSYFTFIGSLMQGDIPEEEVSPEFGPAAEPEGYDGGSFDDHSDIVDFPTDPQSILGLGFINVYKCDAHSLIDLGGEIFPEIIWPSTPSDVWEAVKAVSDSIWNSRLIDYVISVHCVPGDVPAGSLEAIKIGARTMQGIMGRKITSEYVTFDFGSIQTARVFRNYADIMTGCKVFLPFYGFVPLPAEYWNGCTLTLKYKFNVIDGSFMAFLKASDCYYSKLNGVIGQYGGSAVVHMPTTGANYASMFSSVIGSAATLASGIASGNVGKVASSVTSIAANIGSGGDAQGSESYNASSSFMSMRTPFLLIELPVPQFPTKYALEKGLPANITYALGTLQGLVICDSPRITFACTEDEQKEIIAALQEGIII